MTRQEQPTTWHVRRSIGGRSLVVALTVVLLLAACTSSEEGSAPTATLPTAITSPTAATSDDPLDPTPAAVEATPTPTPTTEPVSPLDAPPDAYLPMWVPDGYTLEAVTMLDGPEELETAEWTEADSVTLGDSDVISDVSVMITARRFGTEEDLIHARWVEDATMVQYGGPEFGFSAAGSTFAYDGFGAGDEFAGGQFHGTIDDVLVTGFIFGELSPSDLAQLLATLSVGDDQLTLDIDASEGGLQLLDQGPPPQSGSVGYDLEYGNGTDRFLITVSPGGQEATITTGSPFRESDRLTGDRGSGFIEAQPEVGGALGSRRLSWWVPTVRLHLWIGDVVSDEDAIAVAESFESVTAAEWAAATESAAVGSMDFGPLNLPENPQEKFEERLAERDRRSSQIGSRPDVDVAAVLSFVGDLRGGELPSDASIEWLGPVEADAATSGFNLFPNELEQVYRSLRLIRASDDPEVFAEARRQDVRGICCGPNQITMVEGMDEAEATVVAAHEFTHLYDTSVLSVNFTETDELISPTAALIEGNATRVMIAYRDANNLRFDPDNRPHLQLEMPLAVRRTLRFAYRDGQTFTESLVATAGEAAIDTALTSDPPRSTEQILHPDSYLAGDAPQPVDAPEPPDGAVVDQRATLGAFILALATEDALGWDGAVELMGEWSGDRFIAWTQGQQDCLAANIVFDTSDAASLFASSVNGATATGTDVALQSCAA